MSLLELQSGSDLLRAIARKRISKRGGLTWLVKLTGIKRERLIAFAQGRA